MTNIAKLKKQKKLLLIAIIIVAVLLVADIGVFFVAGRGVRKNFGGGNRPTNMENFDSSNMPEGMGDFDPSNMPEGMGDFDPSNMPEGFTPGNRPSGNRGGGVVGIMCLVIGIVLSITEVILLILFFRTAGKIKKSGHDDDDDESGTQSPVIDPVELRKKKQKREKITLSAVLALMLVMVIVLATLGKNSENVQSVAVDESVLDTTAETGTISQSIKGSGVIAATEEKDVSVAGNITVTQYYVSEGDVVTKGDVIASVDRNSVKAAIGDIQSMLEGIDEEMMEVKDKSVSSFVTAPADGRVVKIYGAKDEDVVDVMYRDSALMLLSLDGSLAVTMANTGDLNMEAEVSVVNEAGKSYTGIVTAVEKEQLTVKVSMDDFSYGEKVTIKDKDSGDTLAEGELYVSNELRITGYSGSIGSIKVTENETVEKGDALITLKNTDYTATYQSLLSKRVKLENQYNELVEIANTGYVYAESDGTIAGVDSTLVTASADTSGNQTDLVRLSTAITSGTTGGFVRLSAAEITLDSFATGETVSRTANIIWLDANGGISEQNLPQNVPLELTYGEVVLDTVLSSSNGSLPSEGTPSDGNQGSLPSGGSTGDGSQSGMPNGGSIGDSTFPSGGSTEDGSQSGMPSDGSFPSGGSTGDGSQSGMPSDGSFPSGGATSQGGDFGMSGGAVSFDGNTSMGEAVQESNTYVLGETVICQLTPNDQVSTGASDGTHVEITGGLSQGQRVYYRYAGTILYTF